MPHRRRSRGTGDRPRADNAVPLSYGAGVRIWLGDALHNPFLHALILSGAIILFAEWLG